MWPHYPSSPWLYIPIFLFPHIYARSWIEVIIIFFFFKFYQSFSQNSFIFSLNQCSDGLVMQPHTWQDWPKSRGTKAVPEMKDAPLPPGILTGDLPLQKLRSFTDHTPTQPLPLPNYLFQYVSFKTGIVSQVFPAPQSICPFSLIHGLGYHFAF